MFIVVDTKVTAEIVTMRVGNYFQINNDYLNARMTILFDLTGYMFVRTCSEILVCN